MNQFIKRLILVGLIFQFVIGCNVKTQKDISIIPKPVSQKQKRGEFTLGQNTKIIAESGVLEMSANFLQNYINEKYGIQVAVAKKAPDKNFIQLYLTDTIENKEGYVLKVRDNVVEIIGKTGAGVFYGIQTFMQMLPSLAKQQKQIKVQAADIEDFPQFGWRGQHLDVARHFFSLDFIKNMLEVMAIHKLNTFHWHLTEDQGWRMEIKKYPKLTQIGAWRDSTLEGYITQYPRKYNRVKYGGFYTQEEIKEIVQYAKERNIRVIPEIEMPGHSLAALAAYPEVSCTGGPFNVATEWGVFEDVYCAGKEKTFEFLENILDEVIQLFPNEYIHIGGDEVLKTRWESCEDCQRRIHEESLKNEDELQSYFIKRIEKYLHNKGKKLIGWDEIIEGGLPERATVMSWRGMDGGIKSAKSHHHTIMAPWSPCYFYLYQGKYEEPIAADDYVPLSAVYNFHPVPDELSEKEAEYILGGQGCAWSEYMTSPELAEYMIYPRLSALAEVLWSEKSQMNWDNFLKRMDDHYLRLDYYNINYRIDYPDNYGFINRYLENEVQIKLDNIISDSEIRYTTDGSEPTKSSMLYKEPITLNLDKGNSVILKSRTFMPNGRKSSVHTGEFIRLEWKESFSLDSPETGLSFDYFEKEVFTIEEITGEPDRTGVISKVKLPDDLENNFFLLVLSGYIKVPEKAVYNFELSTARGKGILCIDEMNVVDNTSELSRYNQQTGKIALKKGYHKFNLKYFTSSHGKLGLSCSYNNIEKKEIPASWFFH